MLRWFPIAALCLVTALPATAGLKKINYGQRSTITDKKADMDVNKPELNTRFGQTSMDLTEWHSQFSRLGQKKSSVVSGANKFSGEKVDFPRQDMKVKNTSMAPGNRKQAKMRNWNYAMDNLMAGKFEGSEITSPAGRKMQQYMDEVSLREVNRFMFAQNKTEDGLPVQRAGYGALDEIPDQMRDAGTPALSADDTNEDNPGQLFRNPFKRNQATPVSDSEE